MFPKIFTFLMFTLVLCLIILIGTRVIYIWQLPTNRSYELTIDPFLSDIEVDTIETRYIHCFLDSILEDSTYHFQFTKSIDLFILEESIPKSDLCWYTAQLGWRNPNEEYISIDSGHILITKGINQYYLWMPRK